MKNRWMVIAALPLVAATAVAAGMQGSKNGGLKRIVDETSDEHEAFDAGAWKKKLATNDLAQREKAFEELADLARHDADAKKTVEAWANDDKDSELAWTSRLLKRELERRGAFAAPFARVPGHRGPMARGQGPNSSGFDWDDFSRRFDDLDSMFGGMRQEWGDMLRGLPSTSGHANNSSRSIELQTRPDGVTCKVIEDVDGKKQEKTYEAKNMEELLDEHPELRENLGGNSFRWSQGTPRGGLFVTPHGRLAIPPRGIQDESGVDANGSPRTDRLGITCSQVGGERAEELGLDEGVGLEVQGVAPGSIASVLGLHEGDVVAEMNGAAIRSADDVRKALADRAGEAEVAVVVYGEDGHRRTLTWKPAAESKSDKKASSSKKSSRDL